VFLTSQEHTDALVLEILGFEVESYQEADRLYVNAEKLYKKLETPELLEKVNAKREEYSRLRKRVPNEEITRSLVQEAAVQYIITRLITTTTKVPKRGALAADASAGQLCASGETDGEAYTDESATSLMLAATDAAAATGTNEAAAATANAEPKKRSALVECAPRFAVDLACLTGDKSTGADKRLDMLLDKDVIPEGIEHINIIRPRKKATNKEFNNTLRLLRQDNDKLNKATSDAQRKAGLAVSSVDGFKNFAMSRKFNPDTMTLPQWRWIWAVRRIILQNYVAAVHVRMERYERERAGGGIDPTELVEGALEGPPDPSAKPRRLKESRSGGTRLPSLMTAKTDRHSMSSLRRLSRGSKEPRPIDEFSLAFSGAVKKHADTHANGLGAHMLPSSSLPSLHLV